MELLPRDLLRDLVAVWSAQTRGISVAVGMSLEHLLSFFLLWILQTPRQEYFPGASKGPFVPFVPFPAFRRAAKPPQVLAVCLPLLLPRLLPTVVRSFKLPRVLPSELSSVQGTGAEEQVREEWSHSPCHHGRPWRHGVWSSGWEEVLHAACSGATDNWLPWEAFHGETTPSGTGHGFDRAAAASHHAARYSSAGERATGQRRQKKSEWERVRPSGEFAKDGP